jgi:hypothetical protein
VKVEGSVSSLKTEEWLIGHPESKFVVTDHGRIRTHSRTDKPTLNAENEIGRAGALWG